MKKKFKPTTGSFYTLTFYDHCETTSLDEEEVVLEIHKGKLIKQGTLYYYLELVNCNVSDNSNIWKVMKSTIIKMQEV